MDQFQQFQVKVVQMSETVQVDIPAPSSGGRGGGYGYGGFEFSTGVTARDLLQSVSDQVGIPIEKLKLAYVEGYGPDLVNMDETIYPDNPNQYQVIVDYHLKMKKEAGTNILMEDLTKLLDDPETSDCTLKCGSKCFKVHKTILSARSNVFRAMFLSGMKETVGGEVVITDVEEKALEEVLYYLYTGKLSGKEFGVKSLCYAADKYELGSLMDMICEKIRTVKLEAGELADVFISSEMFNKEEMYEIAIWKLKKNRRILKDKKFEEKVREWPELLYKIIVSTNC